MTILCCILDCVLCIENLNSEEAVTRFCHLLTYSSANFNKHLPTTVLSKIRPSVTCNEKRNYGNRNTVMFIGSVVVMALCYKPEGRFDTL
jgi:hypothetical protein